MKRLLGLTIALLATLDVRSQCVPAGSVTCSVPGGAGGYSCMSAYSSTAVGGPSPSLAVGDFNMDGLPDLAASPSTNAGIVILENCPGTNTEPTGVLLDVTCTPGAPCPIASGNFTSLGVGDINYDGLPDLVGASNGPAGAEKGVGVWYQWYGLFVGDAAPSLAQIVPAAAAGGCPSFPTGVTVTGNHGTATISAITDPDTGSPVTSRGAGRAVAISGAGMGPGCRVLLTKGTFPTLLEARVLFASDSLVIAEVPNAPAGVPSTSLTGYTLTVHPLANLPGAAASTLDVVETDSTSSEPLPRIDRVATPGACASQTITIEGINFGSYVPGTSQVLVDVTAQTVLTWTETRIDVAVSGGSPGYLTVDAAGGITRTSDGSFVDISATPTIGIDAVGCGPVPGSLVLTRIGGGWQDYPGLVTMDRGGAKVEAPLADVDGDGLPDWSDTSIVAHIPTIPDPVVDLAPVALPPWITGSANSTFLTATGGIAPYRYEIMPSPAPPGFTHALDATTGELTGTPSGAGSYEIAVAVIDALGNVGRRHYVITADAGTWPCAPPAPSWTAGPLPAAPLRDSTWTTTISAGPVDTPTYFFYGPGIPGITASVGAGGVTLTVASPTLMRAGRYPFSVGVQSGSCLARQAYELVVVGLNVEVQSLGQCPTAPFGVPPGISGCDATVSYATSTCFDGVNTIDIYGAHFGTSAEVVIDDGVTQTPIVVSPLDPTHIVVQPPVATNDVTVTVERLAPNPAASVSNPVASSNASEVRAMPMPYGIEGATGASGELPIHFIGGPFGVPDAGNAIVWSATSAPPTSWSPVEVQGHAPTSARDWGYLAAAPLTVDGRGTRGILAGSLAPPVGAPPVEGVRLYLSPGDGTLVESPQWFTSLPYVERHRIAVADVNLDGVDDAVVMPLAGQTTYDGGLLLHLNDGNGAFYAVPALDAGLPATGATFVRVLLADLDANGYLDLVGLDDAGDTHIYFGRDPWAPSSSFFDPTSLVLDQAAGLAPAADVAIADFDGDGVLDLAFSMPLVGAVTIAVGQLAGNGIGCASTYYCPQTDAVITGFPGSPLALAAGFFDADDQMDLAVAAGSDVHVLLNDPATDTVHDANATPGAETVEAGILELLP